MAIEVILKEHVEHLGQRGEVVRVADGYARNYLLPRKLALAVTEQNRRQIERERERAEAKNADELRVARELQARLEGVEITIARRVGENEVLYGSVTSSDIADVLTARDFAVDRRRIHLPEPLKTLGEQRVPLRLTREVSAELGVKVVAAE